MAILRDTSDYTIADMCMGKSKLKGSGRAETMANNQ